MSVVRIRRKDNEVVQVCDVYIGRAVNRGGWHLPKSIWHNPFTIKACGGAEEACRRYEEYILNKPELLGRLEELRGKTLGCFCEPDAPCHGKVLLRLLGS